MKAQGMDQKDPRFLTILKILKVQSNLGHNLANLASRSVSNNTTNNNSASRTGNQTTNGPTVATTSTNSSSSKSSGSGQLSSYQLFQLKAQILAYKYLSRNLPLPPKLLNAIRTFSMRAMQSQQTKQQEVNKSAVPLGPPQTPSASASTPTSFASAMEWITPKPVAPQGTPASKVQTPQTLQVLATFFQELKINSLVLS